MAPNDRARRNHDLLFPSQVSTLATTDPELIEIFDNFAFDEVLQGSTLDVRTRLMLQLAAISPGIIMTPLAKDELTGPRGEGYRRMIEGSVAKRAGTPDEVGAVGALLMGPDGALSPAATS